MLEINETKISKVLYGNNIIDKIYKGIELVYSQKKDENPPIIVVEGLKEATNGKWYTNNPQVNVTDDSSFNGIIYKDGEDIGNKLTKENPTINLSTNGDGRYKIVATDEVGNTSELEFILDMKKPEIIVKKEGTVENDSSYSKISFQLHDNYLVKEYEINEHIVKISQSAWSDANYDNIKQYLKEGDNIIIVRDVAGNETTKKFIIDMTGPEIKIDSGLNIEIVDKNPFSSAVTNKDGKNLSQRNNREDKKTDGSYWDRYNIKWLGEGTYLITATDVLGNVSTATLTQ